MDWPGLVPIAIALFAASALHVHLRGRVRHKFARQLTDHSTFTAPYSCFVYLCSAVPNRPILDRSLFPELDLLRSNWETIRDEALAARDAGFLRAADSYNDLAFNSFYRRGWKRLYLEWYGDPLPSAESLCPKTVDLVRRIPSVRAALLVSMAPHSRLVKHRDPFAGSLRYHLGLSTPGSERCRILVDGEPYVWRDGEDVVFDETFIHRAVNDTDRERIILFCDVERPLRWRLATLVNRFVIRTVLPMTRTRNVAGESVGLANRVFDGLYRLRLPLKRLRRRSKPAYYTLKYAALAAMLALLLHLF